MFVIYFGDPINFYCFSSTPQLINKLAKENYIAESWDIYGLLQLIGSF